MQIDKQTVTERYSLLLYTQAVFFKLLVHNPTFSFKEMFNIICTDVLFLWYYYDFFFFLLGFKSRQDIPNML